MKKIFNIIIGLMLKLFNIYYFLNDYYFYNYNLILNFVNCIYLNYYQCVKYYYLYFRNVYVKKNYISHIQSVIIIYFYYLQYYSLNYTDFINISQSNNYNQPPINYWINPNSNNYINNINMNNMNINQNMNDNVIMELNKYKNENQELKEQISKLLLDNFQLNQNLQQVNQNLLIIQNNYNIKINDLNMKLMNKEKELNDIKNNIINDNNMKKYVDYNKIIVINFMSSDSKINYGIKCLKTDTFAEVEEKLYKIYSEYRETNNTFLSNGKEIKRFKTIEQNNIKDGDKVQLQILSDSFFH